MKAPLRVRYFYWLLGVLLVALCMQVLTLSVHEFVEYRSGESIDVQEEVREVLTVLSVGLIILPFAIFLLWHIAKRMLQPIEAMTETATRIRDGQLEERIRIDNADDQLGALAHMINEAFDSYREAVERVARFSSDASHQLRTPLTAMRSTGEVCLQKPRSSAEYVDTIGSMLEDVKRLSSTIEKLLMLARLDSKLIQSCFRPFDVAEILHEAMARYAPLAEASRIKLSLETEDSCFIVGDAALFHEVVTNLVDNAITYTPQEGAVSLRLALRGDDAAVLTVSDTGQGIPEAYRERVFRRFASIPSGKGQGSGLGLAIVADIVNIHGGSIDLLSNDAGGSDFCVTLPAVRLADYAI